MKPEPIVITEQITLLPIRRIYEAEYAERPPKEPLAIPEVTSEDSPPPSDCVTPAQSS